MIRQRALIDDLILERRRQTEHFVGGRGSDNRRGQPFLGNESLNIGSANPPESGHHSQIEPVFAGHFDRPGRRVDRAGTRQCRHRPHGRLRCCLALCGDESINGLDRRSDVGEHLADRDNVTDLSGLLHHTGNRRRHIPHSLARLDLT